MKRFFATLLLLGSFAVNADTIEGNLEVVIEDHPNHAVEKWFVTSPKEYWEIEGKLPKDVKPGQFIRLQGKANGRKFKVESVENGDAAAKPSGGGKPSTKPGTIGFSRTSTSVQESTGSVSITVARSSGSAGAQTVDYICQVGSAGLSDFTSVAGTLSWASGETTSKTISVPIIDDTMIESSESFTVRLQNLVGTSTLGTSTHTVTITDNDGASASPCRPTGGQNVVVIPVDLPDYKQSTTEDGLRGQFLGNNYTTFDATPDRNADNFFRVSSNNQLWINPDIQITPRVLLSSNYNTNSTGGSFCDYYGALAEAVRLVDSQVDFKKYNRIVIVMPANGACGWAGVANTSCRTITTDEGSIIGTTAWVRASYFGNTNRGSSVQLLTHELGHNLTLGHSSTEDFGAESIGPVGTAGSINEYGDNYSTMGSWNYGLFTSVHIYNMLKWTNLGIQTIETSGVYTLNAFELDGVSNRALRIRRGTTTEWLFLEYRVNSTIYTVNSLATGGAIIRRDRGGNRTYQLDSTPATTAFTDGVIVPGSIWTDTYTGMQIEVLEKTPTYLSVRIQY
jgi:M6 family metalloprotease-like protein